LISIKDGTTNAKVGVQMICKRSEQKKNGHGAVAAFVRKYFDMSYH